MTYFEGIAKKGPFTEAELRTYEMKVTSITYSETVRFVDEIRRLERERDEYRAEASLYKRALELACRGMISEAEGEGYEKAAEWPQYHPPHWLDKAREEMKQK